MRIHGPERLAGQGLNSEQTESGNRAIHALLTDPAVREAQQQAQTEVIRSLGQPGAAKRAAEAILASS